MNTKIATEIADLEVAIATARENVRKAARLGLRSIAQTGRREIKSYTARRDALMAQAR